MKNNNSMFIVSVALLQKLANFNLDDCKKALDIFIPLISILLALVGSIYTLSEYKRQQQVRREDKTIELYMKQFEDPLLESRQNLDIIYNPEERQKLVNILNIIKTKGSNNLSPFNQFILDFSKAHSKDIMTMADFYTSIINCVESKVCDRNKAKDLLKKEGRNFVVTFSPLFCQLRQEWGDKTFAKDLEDFYNPVSERIHKDKPMCNYETTKTAMK